MNLAHVILGTPMKPTNWWFELIFGACIIVAVVALYWLLNRIHGNAAANYYDMVHQVEGIDPDSVKINLHEPQIVEGTVEEWVEEK
jgi:hypothetical protein